MGSGLFGFGPERHEPDSGPSHLPAEFRTRLTQGIKMADGTKIEWTDATWNPITGCSVVSPGCTNCYAMRLAGTRLKHSPSRKGLTTDSMAGPVWNGQVRLNEQWIDQPLHWRTPRLIFVCAHGDLFHENVPDEWIDRVYRVMALASRHTFQILTKRSARMRAYMASQRAYDAYNSGRMGPNVWPPPNVWVGVSVEDQKRADQRIPDLVATSAGVRFVSAEPLIGPLDLTRIRAPLDNDDGSWKFNALAVGDYYSQVDNCIVVNGDGPYRQHRIDWVIVGSDSGPKRRHCDPAWVRSLRDQCTADDVPFFWKQHIENGRKISTPELDGREWREMPE